MKQEKERMLTYFEQNAKTALLESLPQIIEIIDIKKKKKKKGRRLPDFFNGK